MEFNPISKIILENQNLEWNRYLVPWSSLLEHKFDRVAVQAFSTWIFLLFFRCCVHNKGYEIFEENKFLVAGSLPLQNPMQGWAMISLNFPSFLLCFLFCIFFRRDSLFKSCPLRARSHLRGADNFLIYSIIINNYHNFISTFKSLFL
jgi:hypothetical protein